MRSQLVALIVLASAAQFSVSGTIAAGQATDDVGAIIGQGATSSGADELCSRGSAGVLQVVDWAIAPEDNSQMLFPRESNRLTVTFQNLSAKPLRMVDGFFGFVDALGERVASAAIDRDIAVAPGATFVQDGSWGLSTFERLLILRKAEVVSYACVEAVLYDDGTKEHF